jgi:hypothetical protein
MFRHTTKTGDFATRSGPGGGSHDEQTGKVANIHMTLLYLDVTQQDLQRKFHCARQKAASLHPIPKLPLPQATTPERVDLPAIRNAIAVVRHLLQLFRLELQDPNARRKLRRLSQRLLTLSDVLDHVVQE